MPDPFMPYEVFFDTTYGIVLKCWIKSEVDQEKLRQCDLDWRTTGAKSAPLQSGGVNPVALAQKRASRSSERSDHGATGLTSSRPLRSIWRSPEGEKEKLKSDLSALQEMISELAETIEDRNRLLAPYWDAKIDVERSIRRTHGGRPGLETIQFDPVGAPVRKPCFDVLLELAIEWGPTKSDRAELQTRMKACEREAKKIETELKYLAKKEKKHG
jgi:hypothetical protein